MTAPRVFSCGNIAESHDSWLGLQPSQLHQAMPRPTEGHDELDSLMALIAAEKVAEKAPPPPSHSSCECCIMCLAPIHVCPEGRKATKASLPCCQVPACEECCSKWLATCVDRGLYPTCPGGTCGTLPHSFIRETPLIDSCHRMQYLKITPPSERFRSAQQPLLERIANEAWIKLYTKACPYCGVVIAKEGGCNQVSCSQCGGKFCYRCRGGIQTPGVRYSQKHRCPWWRVALDSTFVALPLIGIVYLCCWGLWWIFVSLGITVASIPSIAFQMCTATLNVFGIGAALACGGLTMWRWACFPTTWPKSIVPAGVFHFSVAFRSSTHASKQYDTTLFLPSLVLHGAGILSILSRCVAWVFGLSTPFGRALLLFGSTASFIIHSWLLARRYFEDLHHLQTITVDGLQYEIRRMPSTFPSRKRNALARALSFLDSLYHCDSARLWEVRPLYKRPPPASESTPTQTSIAQNAATRSDTSKPEECTSELQGSTAAQSSGVQVGPLLVPNREECRPSESSREKPPMFTRPVPPASQRGESDWPGLRGMRRDGEAMTLRRRRKPQPDSEEQGSSSSQRRRSLRADKSVQLAREVLLHAGQRAVERPVTPEPADEEENGLPAPAKLLKRRPHQEGIREALKAWRATLPRWRWLLWGIVPAASLLGAVASA